MTGKPKRGIDELHQALGGSIPVSLGQKPFDGDGEHLRRLVGLRPGEPAEPGDLWAYSQDLRYTDIDVPLLVHLLPVCLQAWQDDLAGRHAGYSGFVEHFYPALADRQVFATQLTPAQTAAVARFMRDSILEEIDDQRGLAYRGMNARPYRWIRALTTHGVLLPDIERLWTEWWSLDTSGRGIAVLQYVSALMYPGDQNPVFAPWTSEGGGGPPCLWEYGGHLHTHRWLEPNVAFLRQTLTLPTVEDVIARAVERLAGEPERGVGARMLADLPSRRAMLERRCGELPTILAARRDAGTSPAFSS